MIVNLKTFWNSSVPNPATGGYKIYRKTDGGAAALVGTAAANANDFTETLTGPVGTHTFQYGVSGLNNTGQESGMGLGPVISATFNEPTPSVPTGVDTQVV
jgi:hypothetical protein